MKMQKRMFRIGDLAEKLLVEKFVIRFWEKEFKVKTTRSEGGQRCYSQEDLEQFQRIKQLLYQDGFTIAGAKKELEKQEPQFSHAARKTTLEEIQDSSIMCENPHTNLTPRRGALNQESDQTQDQLLAIREKLYRLKEQLQ